MSDKALTAAVKLVTSKSKQDVNQLISTLRGLNLPEKEVQENVRLFWKNKSSIKS